MKYKSARRPLLLPAMMFSTLAVTASIGFSQTAMKWNQLTPGTYDWNTDTNWATSNVPDASNEAARFNLDVATQLTNGIYNISLSSAIEIAFIEFKGLTPTVATLNLNGEQITLNNPATPATIRSRILRDNSVNAPRVVISCNILGTDSDGIWFRSGGGIVMNGVISGSANVLKDEGGALFLGGTNTFSNGITAESGPFIATVNTAFSSTSGTYSFGRVTALNASGGVGTLATGTTTVNNALNLMFSAGYDLTSGGTGSTLDFTTNSITTELTNIANQPIRIRRAAGNTLYGIANPTGAGTVKFSGTGFTIPNAVTGAGSESILEFAPASGVQTWSGNITGFSGTSSLIKSGNGTVILSGNGSTYGSETRLTAGTLLVNNTSGSGTGNSTVFVDGGTLGGTGTISKFIIVAAGGNLSPGSSGPGTLTCNLAINITAQAAGAGVLQFDLNALASTNDKIVTDTTLEFDTEKLGFSDFVFTNLGGLEVGTYTLIQAATLSGTLDPNDLTGTIGSFNGQIQIDNTNIVLVVTQGSQPAGFSGWITGTFGNGLVAANKQGPNDDPDSDGIRNLVEYAIAGMDPTVSNTAAGAYNSATKTLSFTKRTDASGISYAIEKSTDLGIADTWAQVAVGPAYVNNATTISYIQPLTAPKDFIRLRVTQNP